MSDLDLLLARHHETPGDEVLMGAIADWLDEYLPDQHDLAELYRGGAKAWLTKLAEESGGHGYDEWDDDDAPVRGDDYRQITYADVVQAGHDYADHGDYLTQHGKETLRDGCDPEMYWRCWEVVTGRTRPKQRYLSHPFSCSC